MPKYQVNSQSGYVYPEGSPNRTGLRIAFNTGTSYFLGCCGLAGIENFSYCSPFKDWQDRAEFMACLYRSLYIRGIVIYALSEGQLKHHLHLSLLEIGAAQIAEFPNLYHGPHMISLFKLNIHNICGRYCDKYGDAYAEPPKDEADIVPERMVGLPYPNYGKTEWIDGINLFNGYARLPVKPAQ
jgi:hypothetical protein